MFQLLQVDVLSRTFAQARHICKPKTHPSMRLLSKHYLYHPIIQLMCDTCLCAKVFFMYISIPAYV